MHKLGPNVGRCAEGRSVVSSIRSEHESKNTRANLVQRQALKTNKKYESMWPQHGKLVLCISILIFNKKIQLLPNLLALSISSLIHRYPPQSTCRYAGAAKLIHAW